MKTPTGGNKMVINMTRMVEQAPMALDYCFLFIFSLLVCPVRRLLVYGNKIEETKEG
jgi:hypothetical protein